MKNRAKIEIRLSLILLGLRTDFLYPSKLLEDTKIFYLLILLDLRNLNLICSQKGGRSSYIEVSHLFDYSCQMYTNFGAGNDIQRLLRITENFR